MRVTTPAFVAGLASLYVAVWNVAILRARNRRLVLFRAVTVTLAGILSLALLELPATVGAIDYRRLRAAINEDWNGPAAEFVDDGELSFRHPPNTRWSGRPLTDMAEYLNHPFHLSYQTFSTDNRGFRNLADRDRADIALIGDSYAEGFHVSDEQTVAVRLEALTGRTVENLATSGYGSLQELRVLQQYAVPLGPRMVAWFFFEGNDLDDDQEFENAMANHADGDARRPPEPVSRRRRGFLARSFTLNAIRQLRGMTDWLVPDSTDTFGQFREDGGGERRMYFYDFYVTRTFGDFERERFETTKATFRSGSEICRERHIRLVVFYIPIKFRVYKDVCTFPAGSPCADWHAWDLERRFAAFCREAGIEFVSLTDPMRRAAAGGRLLYQPEDSHWTAAGHAFVAQLVASAWASRAKGALQNW